MYYCLGMPRPTTRYQLGHYDADYATEFEYDEAGSLKSRNLRSRLDLRGWMDCRS